MVCSATAAWVVCDQISNGRGGGGGRDDKDGRRHKQSASAISEVWPRVATNMTLAVASRRVWMRHTCVCVCNTPVCVCNAPTRTDWPHPLQVWGLGFLFFSAGFRVGMHCPAMHLARRAGTFFQRHHRLLHPLHQQHLSNVGPHLLGTFVPGCQRHPKHRQSADHTPGGISRTPYMPCTNLYLPCLLQS